MKLFTPTRIKWIAYILELFLVYIVQSTPNLLPEFLNAKPLLLVVFAVSMAMFEGEGGGMVLGLIAGLLMDLSSSIVFGFYGLVIMIACYVCGALVVFLMRNNIVTAMVMAVGSIFFVELMRWLCTYVLYGDPKTGYFLYAVMLPQLVYTAATMPVAFYFNRSIATHLAEED